ncbi:MAG TPA: ABC transporter permease [Vicinamibacterales bacterium]|nr:ABC transporter permease [Vicinamibacterales bacterium]
MNKILTVATSELTTLVRSKAFLISLILMPVLMAGSIVLAQATRNATDDRHRRFAIVDYSGRFAEPLQMAAAARNEASGGGRFDPVVVPVDGRTADEIRLELSDRVRAKDLFAFVEIPASIADADAREEIRYYSDSPSYLQLPQWLRTTINQLVVGERFRAAQVDPQVVSRLTRPAGMSNLGLLARDATGGVTPAEEVDEIRAFAVPGVMLLLMYITVMSSAPQLLNSAIEEKMSRISEVLIGSVTPFELMMGKLLGCVSVSLLLAAIYAGGGLVVANYWGYGNAVTGGMLAWFALFLVMAVLIFGSIFIAIGAACNDLKDSQSMITPVMILVILPLVTWAAVIRAPDSTLSVALSMFPTSAPFLMLLRISIQPGPPMWQVLLSAAIVAGTTVLTVWAAGRIFRTGILMQGKSASFAEMLRWVRVG